MCVRVLQCAATSSLCHRSFSPALGAACERMSWRRHSNSSNSWNVTDEFLLPSSYPLDKYAASSTEKINRLLGIFLQHFYCFLQAARTRQTTFTPTAERYTDMSCCRARVYPYLHVTKGARVRLLDLKRSYFAKGFGTALCFLHSSLRKSHTSDSRRAGSCGGWQGFSAPSSNHSYICVLTLVLAVVCGGLA